MINVRRFCPDEGFTIQFTIDFDHPAFDAAHQSAEVDFSSTSFVEEVSHARTFGFLRDIEYLRANNLALGGSLDNAIVVDDHGVVNGEACALPMSLSATKCSMRLVICIIGHSIIGRFEGYKSGHALNNQLLRAVLAQKDSYEIVTFDDENDCPIPYFQADSAEVISA